MRAYPRANNQTERNLKAFLVRLRPSSASSCILSPKRNTNPGEITMNRTALTLGLVAAVGLPATAEAKSVTLQRDARKLWWQRRLCGVFT